MKILFIFLTFCISIFADIKFSETKYLSALDMQTSKYGSMNIKEDSFTINYNKPKKETVTYLNDKLTFENSNNEIKEFTYKEHPRLEYFGLLLKSIVNNSYENLDNMFTITEDKEKKILNAKSSISGTIDYLEVFYTNAKLSKIIFYMINKDTITIETIN